MIVFPNCKINLGLNILRKRSDGYHDLETVFYPLPFTDVLEIIEYKKYTRTPSIPFTITGLPVKGEAASNLCIRAYKLLKKDFKNLPHIQVHLHKVIPTGAGLGGGSADAAYTLLLLNDLFHLNIPHEQLIDYAAQLGSDCPFFIINKPCFAKGRGEKLEELTVDLSNYKFIIIHPNIHIDTGRAFLSITPTLTARSLKDIIASPLRTWKDELINDFEKVIFPDYKEIATIKEKLYQAGAIYASMSGSGSTVYGIFEKGSQPELQFPDTYFVKEVNAGQADT
ncbi:MAG: 4-(cytidine 5'-diphospho)-2-C-methyl-D-erythritol kinase [Chitinophagaceae bacterium]|nr:4-(cytidine 5'-diphospho)-2-C-methyl-D-erythritol kinase [Chitinophagaceae bacterium]